MILETDESAANDNQSYAHESARLRAEGLLQYSGTLKSFTASLRNA